MQAKRRLILLGQADNTARHIYQLLHAVLRFTWVFFLATKDEPMDLQNFIKEIENLVDKKVKIIRCDNGTEFKNKVMDDFCKEKVAAGTITNESAVLHNFDSPSRYDGNGEPKSAADDQKQVEDGPDNENDEKDKSNDDSSPKEVNAARQHVNTASPEVNTDSFKLNTVDPSVNIASLYELDSLRILFSTTPNTRIHKDHPITNVIGDVKSSIQTRRMTKPTSEQGFLSAIEPTSIVKALSDSSWVEATQEELLHFKLQQGHRQEEGIEYKEVFALVARIEAIRLFLAYASFMSFLVYQMDVKSAFLYGTIKEEVYVTQPPGFKDPDNPDKVYKVVKALYGLHQAPRGKCKKQTVVVTSTTEVEYVAAASCCRQRMKMDEMTKLPTTVMYNECFKNSQRIQNQLLDYGYNFMNTVINIDNNSTICIIENPVQHSKTKHIEIRHHFIRDCNAKKLIQMVKIHTDHNVADLLTKGFDAGRFQYLVSSIGMLNP
ncbi:putative ribonuclease H-like domain-containing protein [Tanacetum coccineum]